MSRFSVTVRTQSTRMTYSAIAPSSWAAHAAAIDRFGPCYVSVKAVK